jgi:hypothetical protein
LRISEGFGSSTRVDVCHECRRSVGRDRGGMAHEQRGQAAHCPCGAPMGVIQPTRLAPL